MLTLNCTVQELDARCAETLRELQDRIDAYDERAALREQTIQSRSVTELAIAALQRPERFQGEHAVARAWIRCYEPHVRLFYRVRE